MQCDGRSIDERARKIRTEISIGLRVSSITLSMVKKKNCTAKYALVRFKGRRQSSKGRSICDLSIVF